MHLLAALTATATLCYALQVHDSAVSRPIAQEIQQLDQVSPRVSFALNIDSLDWQEAFKACKAWNATLAFPLSPLDGDLLRPFLSDNDIRGIHIGFNSFFVKGTYLSIQGLGLDEIGFWQWDPQSENKTEQRCGALTADGMKTIDCGTKQQSVCEFQESQYFDKIDGFGYYRYHDLTWNWEEAIKVCKIESSNLLILRSSDEYDAIFNYYTEQGFINGSVEVFYGAHQLFADHWYLTLADELVEDSGYDVWAPGEPGDGAGVEFPYVGLRLTDSTTPDADAGMFLLPNGTHMPFICKRELH